VVVATVRALKMHGGAPRTDLETENAEAVARGAENMEKHVENVRRFGVPPVVAINKFATDTDAEIAAVADACRRMDVPVALADVHAHGGEGALELADAVMDIAQHGGARFAPLYELDQPLAAKIERIARDIYGADGVDYPDPEFSASTGPSLHGSCILSNARLCWRYDGGTMRTNLQDRIARRLKAVRE